MRNPVSGFTRTQASGFEEDNIGHLSARRMSFAMRRARAGVLFYGAIAGSTLLGAGLTTVGTFLMTLYPGLATATTLFGFGAAAAMGGVSTLGFIGMGRRFDTMRRIERETLMREITEGENFDDPDNHRPAPREPRFQLRRHRQPDVSIDRATPDAPPPGTGRTVPNPAASAFTGATRPQAPATPAPAVTPAPRPGASRLRSGPWE